MILNLSDFFVDMYGFKFEWFFCRHEWFFVDIMFKRKSKRLTVQIIKIHHGSVSIVIYTHTHSNVECELIGPYSIIYHVVHCYLYIAMLKVDWWVRESNQTIRHIYLLGGFWWTLFISNTNIHHLFKFLLLIDDFQMRIWYVHSVNNHFFCNGACLKLVTTNNRTCGHGRHFNDDILWSCLRWFYVVSYLCDDLCVCRCWSVTSILFLWQIRTGDIL